MKLIVAMFTLMVFTGGAFAQVSPGCHEIQGSGTEQCNLTHVFNDGIVLTLLTVSTLPACTAATKGQLRAVSDATAPTYNGALTGGGAVTVPVICNGTAWLAH